MNSLIFGGSLDQAAVVPRVLPVLQSKKQLLDIGV